MGFDKILAKALERSIDEAWTASKDAGFSIAAPKMSGLAKDR